MDAQKEHKPDPPLNLGDERILEQAENVLDSWATTLAERERNYDAADALRLRNSILKFRTGFLERDKSWG